MALAIGIRPCTGAILVLVFAVAQGMVWAGVLSTFAMALGTAITVSILAASAVASRGLAARLGAGTGVVARGGAVLGYGLMTLFGALMFAASLGPVRPF